MRRTKKPKFTMTILCCFCAFSNLGGAMVPLIFRASIESAPLSVQNNLQHLGVSNTIDTVLEAFLYSFGVFAIGTIISALFAVFPIPYLCGNKKARYTIARLESRADREDIKTDIEDASGQALDDFDKELNKDEPSQLASHSPDHSSVTAVNTIADNIKGTASTAQDTFKPTP